MGISMRGMADSHRLTTNIMVARGRIQLVAGRDSVSSLNRRSMRDDVVSGTDRCSSLTDKGDPVCVIKVFHPVGASASTIDL